MSVCRSIKYMRCRSKHRRCQTCSVVPLLLTQTGTPDMFVCSQMLSQTEHFKIYTMQGHWNYLIRGGVVNNVGPHTVTTPL